MARERDDRGGFGLGLERTHEVPADEELDEQTARGLDHLDALVRASTELPLSPEICDYCGASIEWEGERGWPVRGRKVACRQTRSADHVAAGDAHDGTHGQRLEERARLAGTVTTACPECEMVSVLHIPGLYPVCQCCAWTGWERDG